MRIAILGTGSTGVTLAGGLISAGHDVVFGSRTPDTKSGLPAPVRAHADAIDGADLVVSALQGSIALDALTALAEPLAGHVLLDFGNAITPSFDLMYPNASLGAAIQSALPRTRVVKSLNTLGLVTAVAPQSLSGPSNVFLSGDDADAKTLVTSVLVSLGWPAEQLLDLGGIETARGVEHFFPLFFSLRGVFQGAAINISVVN